MEKRGIRNIGEYCEIPTLIVPQFEVSFISSSHFCLASHKGARGMVSICAKAEALEKAIAIATAEGKTPVLRRGSAKEGEGWPDVHQAGGAVSHDVRKGQESIGGVAET